jgi:hypothetical protein
MFIVSAFIWINHCKIPMYGPLIRVGKVLFSSRFSHTSEHTFKVTLLT